MPLTVYRRHTKTCTKGYPQNLRIQKSGNKTLRFVNGQAPAVVKDCECPIAAEGVLTLEGYITNRSTRTNDWTEAQAIADQWEQWGSTMPPAIEDPVNPTVQYAVESFMTSIGPQGKNIEDSSQRHYNVLLRKRLLPYCELKQYTLIREFDSLDVTTKFTESWVNLNPTKGKKNVLVPKTPVPLQDSSKKSQLELLRIFFEYCKERGWLDHNQAKKIKFSSKTEAKFGMEPHEEQWFFEEIERFTDGHYQTGQENALELKLFCLVMRHAGLRISDALMLNDTALVPRASGEGWAARIYQKKTKEWAYIPIPAFLEADLRRLPFKGEKEGKRYWFWTAEGKLKTAAGNAHRRVVKIVRRVEKEHGPFAHTVTPHTFRHTFSIRHLNAGTGIKLVSRWLGHKSTAVTEKHYAHAIQSTLLASEEAYDLSLQRQDEQAARAKRARIAVVK